MIKLNYKIYGEGEPLVIMHGLYGTLDNWVGIARELQNNFKVIIVDLRNHGKSPHSKVHNYEVMVDDLLNLMNDLEIYSANIMGHSMGGKVAMAFAAFNPERVKRLLIVDISPRTYLVEEGDLQFTEHVKIMDALASLDLSNLNSREDADSFLSKKIPFDRVRWFLLKNLYRNKDKSFGWKLNVSALRSNLENVLQGFENLSEEFKLLDCPVVFIKGGASNYIRDIDTELINSLFPNSKTVSINEASHWVHAEKPNEFLLVVKQFCM